MLMKLNFPNINCNSVNVFGLKLIIKEVIMTDGDILSRIKPNTKTPNLDELEKVGSKKFHVTPMCGRDCGELLTD